jgi:hypothetical protein
MWNVWGEKRGTTGLCWGNLRDRVHLEDLGIDGIMLKWIFKKMWDGGWTGLIWLRIATGNGLLM